MSRQDFSVLLFLLPAEQDDDSIELRAPERDDDLDGPIGLTAAQRRTRRRRLARKNKPYKRPSRDPGPATPSTSRPTLQIQATVIQNVPTTRIVTTAPGPQEAQASASAPPAAATTTVSTEPLKPTRIYQSNRAMMPTPHRRPGWKPSKPFTGYIPVDHPHRGPRMFSGMRHPLSNLFPAHVNYRGLFYESVEHAYQAAKAASVGAWNSRIGIIEACNGIDAMRQGRNLNLTPDEQLVWDSYKVAVMKQLLEEKLKVCPAFKRLLEPGYDYIETTTNPFWGCGIADKKVAATQPFTGANVMGRLLTHLAWHGTFTTTSGSEADDENSQ